MTDMVEEGLLDRSGTMLVLATGKAASLNQTFRTGKRALITSRPVFNDQGHITMVITVVRDMTDIYNLESKCRASEQKIVLR